MPFSFVFFFFNDTATTEIYTLSLHDALPISDPRRGRLRRRDLVGSDVGVDGPASAACGVAAGGSPGDGPHRSRLRARSEEHTSELQSRQYLVCRLLLEKKKKSNRSSSTLKSL